ncbi:hypothetical protein QBC39DRAFT_350213 [Podospora conica]|nr:hypothetical protein QBC39DRAFT_350213 [Schizothecium conicum]
MSSLLRTLTTRLGALTLRPSSLPSTTRPLTTTPALHASVTVRDKKVPKKMKRPAGTAVGHRAPHPSSLAAHAIAKEQKRKNSRKQERDPKIINMLTTLASLSPKRIPPPLRMARNRHLRHWTIHRGWLMFRRRQREARERVLMKQHQSMSDACEALRLTFGPGTRPTGYLYRVAMEKKGLYGLHGIPIEYARPQVDTPPREAWNHEWKAEDKST